MRSPRSEIAVLLLAILAAPALGGNVERDLPADRPLEIALWSTDLRIVLRPGAAPRLTARAVTVEESSGEAVAAAGPTVELREAGAVFEVVRAAESRAGGAAESRAVRLRVEVTLDVGHPVKVTGHDLDVAVEAPPPDFRRMAARRRLATERGEEPMAPEWTDVSLAIEDSRADLSGVTGGVLRGRDSWFFVRRSANRLTVELEGGAAELRAHRGELRLEVRGGDVELRDAMGEISLRMEGGSLDVSDAQGRLEGQTSGGATVRLDDWGGRVELESSGSVLELRNFRPGSQALHVRAEDSELTVETMASGQLELDQQGGRLRVLDVAGKMKLTAGRGAEVELERLAGPWRGVFADCTVVVDDVERFDVELSGADLRLTGAEDLQLTASASTISVSEVGKMSRALLVDTTGDLELTEGSRAQIEARGRSRVSVGMPAPCFVLTPSPRREATGTGEREAPAGLDVSGCTLGANVGGGEPDPDRPSPSFLTLTLDDEAELDVRGR